jgi:hypothetical protein
MGENEKNDSSSRLIQPFTLREFIEYMRDHDYPFLTHNSYALEFLIFSDDMIHPNENHSPTIMLGLPSCENVAKEIIHIAMNHDEELIKNTMESYQYKSYLDFLVENYEVIYINHWQAKTALTVSDEQAYVLKILNLLGYVTDQSLESQRIVIRNALDACINDGTATVYKGCAFVDYDLCNDALQKEIRDSGIPEEELHDYFYRNISGELFKIKKPIQT